MKIERLKRTFEYNGMKMKDPGAEFSSKEVKDMYTLQYPELTSAVILEDIGENGITYKFVRQVGTKG